MLGSRGWARGLVEGGGFPCREPRASIPLSPAPRSPHPPRPAGHGVTACGTGCSAHALDDAGRVTAHGCVRHRLAWGSSGLGDGFFLRCPPPLTPDVARRSGQRGAAPLTSHGAPGSGERSSGTAHPWLWRFLCNFPTYSDNLNSEGDETSTGPAHPPPRRARPPLSQASHVHGHRLGVARPPPPDACVDSPHWGPAAPGRPSRPRPGQ